MKPSSTRSLRKSFRDIRLAVLALVAFAALQGAILWRLSNRGEVAIRSLEREGLPGLQLLASLQESLALYRLYAYESLFAQAEVRAAKTALAETNRLASVSQIRELKTLFPNEDVAPRIAAVEKASSEVIATFGRIRSLVDTDFGDAMTALDEDLPPQMAALARAAEELKLACYAISEERADHTADSFAAIRRSVAILGVLTVSFAALAAVLVGFLARSSRMALDGIVVRLRAGATAVAEAAGRLTQTGRKLAESGASQAASVEETSASIEEIRSMVQRNSEHASHAKSLADEARAAAENGAREMTELSSAIDDIQASSDKISAILKTIDEIAFQTNLLALNAAIEAARAGDAGLGFAVVADEVRGLARRAGAAARETATSIEESLGRSARGVEISRRVASGLDNIVTKAREVDELIRQIAAASAEQARGISHINGAMNSLDTASQAIAAEADHSAAAAGQFNSQAEELRATVDDLVRFVDPTRSRNSGGGNGGKSDTPDSAGAVQARTPKPRKTPGTLIIGGRNGKHAAAPAPAPAAQAA